MDILKLYIQNCKEKYAPMGFRRIRQTYARIVNDVMQTFTFKRYRSGLRCTVEFGVFPLCQNILYPDFGDYTLEKFEVETYCEDWRYDKSDESIEKAVQQIDGAIGRNLMPLFAKAGSCESALPALIELDENFQSIRQVALKRKGIEDCATDWRQASLMNGEKLFMALKIGQYDYAKKAAQAQIPYRFPEDKELLQSIIDQLNAGNIEYIEEILTQNEQKSLENLKAAPHNSRLTP